MKYLILITTCVSILTIGLNAQNHQEIESPTADVLSLNSTGSSSTVLNFLNANAAPTGGSDKRAYMSTNGNILNLGLSNNNTGGRIEFFGQGLRRMTMNADGRFGIGNIIPTQQLDVDGQARIRNLPAAAATDSYVTADALGNLRMKSSSSPTYAIGDYAQGGVIFWLSPDGRHGKVISTFDVFIGVWSNVNTIISLAAMTTTNGAGNTLRIMLQSGHTQSAAQACAELDYGGYDDWYLPADDELTQIHNELSDINNAMGAYGEILTGSFWSSTEAYLNSNGARSMGISSGAFSVITKSSQITTRAVRAFFLD